jgi:DNA-binding response OmpR family regulator
MVITDMRMESDSAGMEVVAAAKKAPYRPAVAMLTAFPLPGSEGEEGADKLLVKPMNTSDLLVQLEALLVTHEDDKRRGETQGGPPATVKTGRKASADQRKPATSSLDSQKAGRKSPIKLAEAR